MGQLILPPFTLQVSPSIGFLVDLSYVSILDWQRLVPEPMAYEDVRAMGLMDHIYDVRYVTISFFNQQVSTMWQLCLALCKKPIRLFINALQMSRR